MEIEIDHYQVLGLPSGEEGEKLTIEEIGKAYKAKALKSHPDKRRNDPKAPAEFQRIKSSYDILNDEKARKLFDDLLRAKFERQQRRTQTDSKRQKMMSDLERREREASASDDITKSRYKEDMIAKKLKEEIDRIRARHGRNATTGIITSKAKMPGVGLEQTGTVGLDGERALKVSWEGSGIDYSADKLKELFGKYGDVEDVVIRSRGSKRKIARSALVVMASKEAALASLGCVFGDLSNPLLVLPLHKGSATESQNVFAVGNHAEVDDNELNNLVSAAGHKAKEDSILNKLLK
ncbi:hypothetical protein GIB67_028257, partial [Kingdonia uniflora]